MVRCIPITFTQARTGLQGMRVNSSALRKRELGKDLVLVSILPNSPAVPVDCVCSHNVVRSSPVPAPCSKQSKIDCHADVLTATWWLLAAAAWCTRRHAMPARELLETHSSLMAAPSNWRPRRKPPTAAMRLRFSRAVWSFENPLNELERTSVSVPRPLGFAMSRNIWRGPGTDFLPR